jgi:hypothetical protein
MSDPLDFDPSLYGIEPMFTSTALWRGYWCEYEIVEGSVCLKNLYVNSEDGQYPIISGVSAKAEKGEDFEYHGCHLYEGIDLPIDYSGKILLGRDFKQECYIHMGFQRPWAYDDLIELVFENGRLFQRTDLSEVAKKIRLSIEENPEGFSNALRGNLLEFIESSFSRDIPDWGWWLGED